uniref:TATA-binding protein interacting (TIP20) domain-containing protein n=1 Tax=Fagus sylvatica TaxID=28930 RepID=A0A2N9I012_FAGSY
MIMNAQAPTREVQLLQAGNRLVNHPSSIDELLSLLDRVENLLSKVEQCPTKSMRSALFPSVKALVADQLFRHANADVKVAVASCISEITRISALDAPYVDDQIKEVFKLIVSSLNNLSNKSSRSYRKMTSILETVAKVRSCVVMLDLECETLILEMFQNFLKSIRDYHPENVFSSMETIMTLVLQESDNISLELLTPILASVKRNNGKILPVAWKLAKRVLENSSTKLKPYLIQAVDTLGISFDDYSNIVASICQETSSVVNQNEDYAAVDDYSNIVASICQETSSVVDQNEDHAAGIDMIDENQSMRTSLAEIDKMGTMVFSTTEDKLALFATLIPHIEFVIPDKFNDVEFKAHLFSVLPTVVSDLKQVLRVRILLLQHFKTRGRVFSNQRSIMRKPHKYYFIVVLFNFGVDCMFILGLSI